MTVGGIVVNQLGGSKFFAMTGAVALFADNKGLCLTIPRNKSKANRLLITLNADDTYTMRFFRYTAPRLNHKTMMYTEEKSTDITVYPQVYCNQLQSLFTQATGMHTYL